MPLIFDNPRAPERSAQEPDALPDSAAPPPLPTREPCVCSYCLNAPSSEQLFNTHSPSVRSYAQSIASHRDDAEDLMMEAYARLLFNFEAVAPHARVAYWKKTVLNLGIDRMRRDKFSKHLSLDTLHDECGERVLDHLPTPDKPAHHRMEQEQLREMVRDVLDALPDPQRELLIAHHMNGEEIKSMCERFSLPPGTVKSRMKRGRERMAKRLSRVL